jgi:PAS domain S-box-containing protein
MLFAPNKLAQQPLSFNLVYNGTTVQRERSIVTKSGKELPVLMNSKKVEDDCLQAIFHDLSELRESEERFRLAVEGSRDGLWDWDLTTGEAFYSDRVAAMLGYEAAELSTTRDEWNTLIHPEDRQTAAEQIDEYLKGKKDFYESTFRMQPKNGSYRWITARGKALFNEQGMPTRFLGFNTDITAQKEQTASVERLLSEKEHLLQEVNHRVKNNLAMVSSLINLKQSTLKEKVDLSDLTHQINAIRIVHDKLHSTQEFTSIDFQSYCRDLLADIFSTPASPPVELKLDMSPLPLPVKTIIPLGLIINEIATNAIKYGFTPDSQARFTVRMLRDSPHNQLSLSLANSGRRFEHDPRRRSEETVGLRLVDALVNQLRGTLQLETEPETSFTIVFPIPEEETL